MNNFFKKNIKHIKQLIGLEEPHSQILQTFFNSNKFDQLDKEYIQIGDMSLHRVKNTMLSKIEM